MKTSSHICQKKDFFLQRQFFSLSWKRFVCVPPLGHRSKAVGVLPDQWCDRWEAPEKTDRKNGAKKAVGFRKMGFSTTFPAFPLSFVD